MFFLIYLEMKQKSMNVVWLNNNWSEKNVKMSIMNQIDILPWNFQLQSSEEILFLVSIKIINNRGILQYPSSSCEIILLQVQGFCFPPPPSPPNFIVLRCGLSNAKKPAELLSKNQIFKFLYFCNLIVYNFGIWDLDFLK